MVDFNKLLKLHHDAEQAAATAKASGEACPHIYVFDGKCAGCGEPVEEPGQTRVVHYDSATGKETRPSPVSVTEGDDHAPQGRPRPRQVSEPRRRFVLSTDRPAETSAPVQPDRPAQPVSAVGSADVPADLGPYDPPLALTAPFGYLCGTAGTGKTFLCRRHVQEVKGTTLCATTGIAAVNLGGDVTTINALLGYFNTESLEEQYTTGRLASKLRKLRMAGVRRLVLDEVSMMHAEQLTYLVRAIEEVNGSRYQLEQLDEEDEEKLQEREELSLTLVGDFAQLGPIGDRDDKGKKRPAKYAFESPEWHRFEAGTTQLTEIRRQSDRAFIEALQAVRRGDRDVATAFFAPYLHQTQDREYPGPLIVAKNEEVERWNQLRLDELTTPTVLIASSRWGEQRPEWKDIPEMLILKPGALVMILSNYRIAPGAPYEYVNGDIGIFNEKDSAGVTTVTLQRTGQPVIVNRVIREKKIPLEPGRRKELKEQGKEHLIKEKWEITGAIDYLPLRLAYASTTHKSQGLSFDQVQVNIGSHFFTQPGMLYVALSRARTLEGLRLVGSAEGFRARCTRNEKVARWL